MFKNRMVLIPRMYLEWMWEEWEGLCRAFLMLFHDPKHSISIKRSHPSVFSSYSNTSLVQLSGRLCHGHQLGRGRYIYEVVPIPNSSTSWDSYHPSILFLFLRGLPWSPLCIIIPSSSASWISTPNNYRACKRPSLEPLLQDTCVALVKSYIVFA